MAITDNFIATGTQLKIEKPTKGMVATVCDSIEGPIVKLYDGSVKRINSTSEAKSIYKEVEEIIYLGDLLFPFSDLANRNANLIKPGYVEEWWKLGLREKNPDVEKRINPFEITLDQAIQISLENNIPLNPKFILFWTQISKEELFGLIDWFKYSRISKKIILPYTKLDRERFALGKRALELLGVEHDVSLENVVLDKETSRMFFANLGFNLWLLEKEEFLLNEFIDWGNIKDKLEDSVNTLSFINSVSKLEIKDKAGDFIGTRMGRPEKAKLRKLTGSPNILFPVGKEGGRLRSVYEAMNCGGVHSRFPINFCEKCNKETIYQVCRDCGSKAEKRYYCRECDLKKSSPCEEHKNSVAYASSLLDLKNYFKKAQANIGMKTEEFLS